MHPSISLALALFLTACQTTAPPTEAPVDPTPEPGASEPTMAESVLASMNPEIDPCEDFYTYACGGWIDQAELPADKPWVLRSFTSIEDSNDELLREIIEQAAEDAKAGTGDDDWQLLGRYFNACMDEEAIDEAGVEPLAEQLEWTQITDETDRARTLARLHTHWSGGFFDFGIQTDSKDPDVQVLGFVQAGMGLPRRAMYFDEDERSVSVRAAYLQHVANMLILSGTAEEDAGRLAEAVVALETKLADKAWNPADLYDPEKTYNAHTRDELFALNPDFDFAAYFDEAGLPEDADGIQVNVVEYLVNSTTVMGDADPETLSAYLRWHLLLANATKLTQAIADEHLGFYGTTLSGVTELPPRWQRCIGGATQLLPEIVGKYYVEVRFGGDSKQAAVDMIHGIEDVFAEHLGEQSWMDEATKERAHEKLDQLHNMIGYPDKWKDYSALSFDGGHLTNVMQWRDWKLEESVAKIGNPPDKTEWYMAASAVNAYYNPTSNQMVFPSGILQPPFFKADWPTAMQYGGIGMVVGHELSHGFDNNGRKFDGSGRMVEWWEPEVAERFEEAAQCVSDAYSEFEVQEGLHVDGELTLGENIADIGGLKYAHLAWKATDPGETPSVEGLTDEQLLFVAFAQGWCSVSTPEFEQMMTKGNSHTVPRYRVIGTVRNLQSFADAFECPVGSPMNPEAKCDVW